MNHIYKYSYFYYRRDVRAEKISISKNGSNLETSAIKI